MNLALTRSTDHLYATLSGAFSLAEAERTFLDIIAAAREFGLRKVLVDGRLITGQPTTMDRFHYGQFVANAAFSARVGPDRQLMKFSYVLLPPVIDQHRLGETVAANRGMNVRTFERLDDALSWLGAGTDAA